MRLRIPLVGSLALAQGLVVLASGGGAACTTHQCDGDFQDYFGGHVVDPDTYETNAFDEPWLDYPGMRTFLIHFPIDFGRPPVSVEAYVATDPNANGPGQQWAEAAGNLAEISLASSAGIFVTNSTCSAYYLRVVVNFPPAAVTDGGTE
jgi:hypothetical protein